MCDYLRSQCDCAKANQLFSIPLQIGQHFAFSVPLASGRKRILRRHSFFYSITA